MGKMFSYTLTRCPIDIMRRWTALFLCLMMVWMLMFVMGPALRRLAQVSQITTYIEETGINASALYYTGLDETAEAEMYLYNSDTYAPGR